MSIFTKLIADATAPAEGTPLGQILPVTDAYSKGSSSDPRFALKNAELLISNVIGFITTLGGLFFLIYFFTGAFTWITAGGDKSKTEKARGEMTNAAVGMIILVAAYSIVGLIGSIVGFNVLDFGGQFKKLIPGLGISTPTF